MKYKYLSALFVSAFMISMWSCSDGSNSSVSETDISVSSSSEETVTTKVSENVPDTSAVSSVTSVQEVSKTTASEKVSTQTDANSVTEASKPSETEKPADNSQPQKNEEVQDDHHDQEQIGDDEPDLPPQGDLCRIVLSGDSASCSSPNVSINGSSVTVTAEGTYRISGTLEGQIVVNAPKDALVVLELEGVNISNGSGSAVYIESADKVKISSCAATSNVLSDGGSSVACIYSKDDLTLKGEGSLEIRGNVKNAVNSKNKLKVTGGDLTVSAVNNALVAKDTVVIETGNITITGCKDGIKATNDTEAGKGTVSIIGGTLDITAEDDAVQAVSAVTVSGCRISTSVGGKKINCEGERTVDEDCIS